MASQSLVAFLAEAASTVEPRSNGEAGVASPTAGDSVPSEDTATCPLPSDASLACTNPIDNATAPLDASHASDSLIHAAHTAPPDATNPLDAHIHAAPPEEAQKGEIPMESMDIVESIEKPLSPDNAEGIEKPLSPDNDIGSVSSTEAVITGCIEAGSTPSTAAVGASDASEAIVTTPSAETLPRVTSTLASTEAVIVGAITVDPNAAASPPPGEAVIVDAITVDSNAAAPPTPGEAVIVDAVTVDSNAAASAPPGEAVNAESTNISDSIAVATTDSTVVAAMDTLAPLAIDSAAPITTDSTIIEANLSSPASSLALSKPELDPPSEELNQTAAKTEEEFPPEIDSIQIPAHWHPKPCVHISSIGGALTEEDEP